MSTHGRDRDGRTDFDFLVGSWTVRNRRLRERLNGCADWEEFEGTCHARTILGGLGNLDEFTMERASAGFRPLGRGAARFLPLGAGVLDGRRHDVGNQLDHGIQSAGMTAGSAAEPRLYDDLAGWWPLLSPPAEYVDEASDLLPRLGITSNVRPATLLELGSGGGSLAFHLKRHFQLTLTDKAPAMLAVSQAVNPECEHLVGDMRALRLGRQFDLVLIHDAITYATDPAAVQATLRTAAIHCRAGGTVAVLPDYVRETFVPETDHGGNDAADGRGLRYLEWTWDPDPTDDTYTVDYAFLLRAGDGTVTVEHDRHVEGLFARDRWLKWFAEAGIPARSETDPWERDVFIGTRSTSAPRSD